MSTFTSEQRLLLESMWKISEEGWSSGWMKNLEFEIWKIMEAGPQAYRQTLIDDNAIKQLRYLAENAKGWIYGDAIEQETWIEQDKWAEMYAEWLGKNR